MKLVTRRVKGLTYLAHGRQSGGWDARAPPPGPALASRRPCLWSPGSACQRSPASRGQTLHSVIRLTLAVRSGREWLLTWSEGQGQSGCGWVGGTNTGHAHSVQRVGQGLVTGVGDQQQRVPLPHHADQGAGQHDHLPLQTACNRDN